MSSAQIAVYRLTQQELTRQIFDSLALTDIAERRPGIYTVLRTFHSDWALGFERHLARLEESARLTGIPLTFDHAWLRTAVRHCLRELNYTESRFCVSVPCGQPGTFYLALEPLRPVPPELLRDGVHVYPVELNRLTPRAKTTDWLALRRAARRSLPEDAYEGFLTGPGGTILEGMSSNFYAVQNGELRTAGEGVLHGTARAVLLRVAPDILPVKEQPVALADLPRLNEAMLTSSSRGVVPITRINGQPVNNGRPGPITKALQQRYDAWAEAHLEPI